MSSSKDDLDIMKEILASDDVPIGSWSNSQKFWQKLYADVALLHRLFFGWLSRNVYGHPKNLLDLKRPIVRSGPLSIF
jgi:hypothetical protein